MTSVLSVVIILLNLVILGLLVVVWRRRPDSGQEQLLDKVNEEFRIAREEAERTPANFVRRSASRLRRQQIH